MPLYLNVDIKLSINHLNSTSAWKPFWIKPTNNLKFSVVDKKLVLGRLMYQRMVILKVHKYIV